MRYIKCGSEKFEFEIKPLGGLCKLCQKEPSVVTLTTQNLKLCKTCFNKIQEKRVKEAVSKFKMFNERDKIGIFLSGGKDSATLAHLLINIFPEYNFQGIYLNLGIRYYSDLAEEAVKRFCQKFGLPLYVYNLPEREGFRIDDFVLTSFQKKICSVCGTVKRALFTKIAKELGLTVIATGHHLDDLLSTYLNLFLTGDFISIKRLSPKNPPLYEGQATKVKPLYQIPEREIFYYAILNELPIEGCSCPHGEITPSKKLKNIIENISEENKTFKYQLLSVFLNKFIPLLKKQREEEKLSPCLKCREFTASPNQICGLCRRKELLSKIEDKTLELTLEDWYKLPETERLEKWCVFDLREEEDRKQKGLEGARGFPLNLLEKDRELYKFLKPFKGKKLLFYCYSGTLSYLLTLKLRKLGFKAYNLKNPETLLKN